MTYEPTPGRRVLLLRPAKYAAGDGYGAFGPDGNRLVEYWRAHGAKVAVREINVTDNVTGAGEAGKDAAAEPHKARMLLRFKRLLGALAALPSAMPHVSHFDTLVIACHGWRTGLQLGVTTANVDAFALALIAAGLTKDADIFLAACSAGTGGPTGDRSVADMLRDALTARGHTVVTVYAHTTEGEAIVNPNVRVFCGNGTREPLEGGYYLVSPKTPAFKRWSKKMRTRSGTLRFRFFDMSNEEIAAEIGA